MTCRQGMMIRCQFVKSLVLLSIESKLFEFISNSESFIYDRPLYIQLVEYNEFNLRKLWYELVCKETEFYYQLTSFSCHLCYICSRQQRFCPIVYISITIDTIEGPDCHQFVPIYIIWHLKNGCGYSKLRKRTPEGQTVQSKHP